ncbi:hypothetical protein [Kitasatospora sp. NPDC057936]|uniref:hypothetical protein n=1 Tax=Kitasatospora sp. NPDC057936 TaxID=3346283 RepID=UPI0036D849F3
MRQDATGAAGAAVFTLGELLADVSTGDAVLPRAWESQWDPRDDWNPPPSSASALLGTVVPHCAVLALAGALSASAGGMDAELRVEALGPTKVLMVYQERRFGLGLSDGACTELCRDPGCEGATLDDEIPFCTLHLRSLDLYSLVEVARSWA